MAAPKPPLTLAIVVAKEKARGVAPADRGRRALPHAPKQACSVSAQKARALATKPKRHPRGVRAVSRLRPKTPANPTPMRIATEPKMRVVPAREVRNAAALTVACSARALPAYKRATRKDFGTSALCRLHRRTHVPLATTTLAMALKTKGASVLPRQRVHALRAD